MSEMMRHSAIRAIVCMALLLGGISSGAAVAGTSDPIGTITSAVSTVLGQTTVASNLVGTATSATGETSGSASGSLADVTSALSGSGTESSTDSGPSTSRDSQSSRRASASNPGSPRTRFDRLPRRYEILLERIEFGHHVRANVDRLRALLASASPEFRARLLRLIRAEIRRLQRGGLTPRERAAVRRLRFLAEIVRGAPAGSGATAASVSLPEARMAGGGVLSATAGGTRSGSEAVTRRRELPDRGAVSTGDGPLDVLPYVPSGRDWWAIVAFLLSFLGACFVFMVLLAGRRRNAT
jgi:hypothetical protein